MGKPPGIVWVEKRQAAVSAMGGPLGIPKEIAERCIDDVRHEVGAFVVVRAESHAASARLFDKPRGPAPADFCTF